MSLLNRICAAFALLIVIFTLLQTPNAMAAGEGVPGANGSVKLIEPLGKEDSIPVSGKKPPLFTYLQDALGFIHEIAVGVTILWLVVGGIMIMVSGNNNSLREQGKNHATWAMTGLLMLFLLGFILELLNSAFFQQ